MKQEIEEWLLGINERESIPTAIKALYFGLFETEDGYGISLTGSCQYDEDDDDWACNIDYRPTQQYLLLNDMESKGLDWNTFLNAVAETISSFLHQCSKEKSYPFGGKIIAVGFDDGELVKI